jgi:mycothiol synthase
VFASAIDAGSVPVTVWWPAPTDAVDHAAAAAGFAWGRDLFQLRRPLPLSVASDLEVRAFVPGSDDVAWLEVNNRAFEWHTEQGGWSIADLKHREDEGWFDPAGFLLHEEDGKLAGFCWTKIHAAEDPPLGEIYVIGVDPAFAGRGFGKKLTVAGLTYLAGRGIRVGMLYVDASNTVALAMYDHLGFTAHHVHRSYISPPP